MKFKLIYVVLTAAVLTAALINNGYFPNPSLAAYFYYVIAGTVLTGSTALFGVRPRTEGEVDRRVLIAFGLLVAYLMGRTLFAWNGALSLHHFLLLTNFLLLAAFTFLIASWTLHPAAIYRLITYAAVLESGICLLQAAGWVPALNKFFSVTGSWVNPNVTAIFLAMAVPAMLLRCCQADSSRRLRGIYAGALVIVLAALILLRCRTAWVGAMTAATICVALTYRWDLQWKQRLSLFQKILSAVLLMVLIVTASWLLYTVKQDSADGRRLIWKISGAMIKERPLTGVGYGMFEHAYNLRQSEYFAGNRATPGEVRIAGFTHMAYNEFMQLAVEAGLPCLFLFIFLLASLLRRRPAADGIAAYAGVAGFVMMSCLNFTFQAIPAMLLFLLYAAVLSVRSSIAKKNNALPQPDRISPWLLLLRGGVAVLSVYLLCSQLLLAISFSRTREARDYRKSEDAASAIDLLASMERDMKESSIYWHEYGAALADSKRYREALDKYSRALDISSDPALYLQVAYCYHRLQQDDSAIRACTVAKNILPGYMGPVYSLMQLYAAAKDSPAALAMAGRIVQMAPRLRSAETDYYQEEARRFAERYPGVRRPAVTGAGAADPGSGSGLEKYPPGVRKALQDAGANRQGLMRALDHFYQTGDSLKIAAVNFLVTYMPLHSSISYYWADEQGRRIPFNELDYPSFNAAVLALDALKTQYKRMHPVPYSYRDIDSMDADNLIENIDLAFEKLATHKNLYQGKRGFADFLEYTLPYRVSVEPLERWRKTYAARFQNLFAIHATAAAQELQLRRDIDDALKNTWGTEGRTEPLPRLGAMQILLRGKGGCEDLADLATFIARSQGVPSAVDNIPFWATTGGSHFLNFLSLTPSNTHFDVVLDSLGREPSKVLRTTYSSQKDAIATRLDSTLIPPGFLRLKNFKDVTQEYWPTTTIRCPMSNDDKVADSKTAEIAWLAVFNSFAWRAVWYGAVKDHQATFANMSKGAVYLPMYYREGKLVPAGWPYACGYRRQSILKPDTMHTRSISIREQDKYLKFRPGKKCRLYFWNHRWQLTGEQISASDQPQLVFASVPCNSLLLLVPEYSEGKERPFTITESGDRVWW